MRDTRYGQWGQTQQKGRKWSRLESLVVEEGLGNQKREEPGWLPSFCLENLEEPAHRKPCISWLLKLR